ncbi:superinfection immunity protein [Streptomyces lasiicapitis]|uniref:superinfection immunity protein n=1 Tax=Streptomyces lasiicapitis TaxID=1923961 RepID=UPI003652FB66
MLHAEFGALVAISTAVLFGVLYLFPALLAFWRERENRWLVLAVNLLFGASVLGWFFALYLATRSRAAAKEPPVSRTPVTPPQARPGAAPAPGPPRQAG